MVWFVLEKETVRYGVAADRASALQFLFSLLPCSFTPRNYDYFILRFNQVTNSDRDIVEFWAVSKNILTEDWKKSNQTRSFPINWQLKFTLPGFHWSDVNARTPFPISRYEQYFNILSWRMKLELVKNINFQIIINIFTLWSVTLVCINRPSNLQRFGFAERGHCEIITNASRIVSQLQMLNDEKYRRNRSTNNSIRNPIINNHFDVIFLLVSFIRSLANFFHTSVATWCDMKHLLICSFLTASFHCSTICMPIFCFVPDERFEFCTHIKHSLIM